MLGWFKKKNKKKTDENGAVEETIADAAEIREEEGAEETFPAVEKKSAAAADMGDEASEQEAEYKNVAASAMEHVTATQELEEQSEEESAVELHRKVEPPPVSKPSKNNFFSRLQAGLSKTRKSLVYRLDTLFLGKKEIDQELFDDLEEILITADLGFNTVQQLLEEVKIEVKRAALNDPQALKGILSAKLRSYLLEQDESAELALPETGPLVIMVVGVNGVGKTTSIGKIAAKFVRSGRSVLLVAADTFRAAAIDQLKIWGERSGVEVIAQKPGADPSSVAFDAIELGVSRKYDVLLIDTAGRLHTQTNLMEELKKIKRVIGKKLAGAPHEVMLVIDATTGQNAISQAKLFNEAVGITGVTLTKLDGTAKGGIVINICRELKIPVRFIGVGEQIDDLRDFDANEFVDALFSQSAAVENVH